MDAKFYVSKSTVRPNKRKPWSLEQRKVFGEAVQEEEVARALKSLVRQNTFKSQVGGGGVAGYVISSCTIL